MTALQVVVVCAAVVREDTRVEFLISLTVHWWREHVRAKQSNLLENNCIYYLTPSVGLVVTNYQASFTVLMFRLSLIHPNYSFVRYSYLINLYCIDFFCIFLLGFIKQKFKTTSWKKGHIFQTPIDGAPKDLYFCAWTWMALNLIQL